MHRPFYVLFVLLQTLGCFLFLVRSIRGDDPDVVPGDVRGGILVIAWDLDPDCCEDSYDECAGIEDLSDFGDGERDCPCRDEEITVEGDTATNDEPTEDEAPVGVRFRLPWCPADPGGCAGMGLLGTGYDEAYDFAMFEGRYLNIAPSHSTVDEESSPSAVVVFAGPSTSLYYEDVEGCLHGGSVLSAELCPTAGNAEVDVAADPTSMPVEAEGWREALASCRAWCADSPAGQDAWQALVSGAEQTRHTALTIWNGMWRESAPVAVYEVPPSYPVHRGTVHASVLDYREEVALMNAAYTLDQLSLRLQEAAQYLRYLAADRIVAKANSRRVAQRAD